MLQPEFELATSDMIVQFALRSLGVGFVMRDFAKEALDSGRLFELRFNKMLSKRSFCVVRSRTELTVAAAKLLEILGIMTGKHSASSEKVQEPSYIGEQ